MIAFFVGCFYVSVGAIITLAGIGILAAEYYWLGGILTGFGILFIATGWVQEKKKCILIGLLGCGDCREFILRYGFAVRVGICCVP